VQCRPQATEVEKACGPISLAAQVPGAQDPSLLKCSNLPEARVLKSTPKLLANP
jgi:hypothetical protein